MKLSPSELRLYAVTDRRALPAGVTLAQAVEAALDGGVTCLQLREKEASAGEILALARTLLPLCRARRVPLLINDRVDIALAVGADGVHVGQDDLPAGEVRRILGPDKIVGVSAGSVAEAVKAEEDGADYLGVGAMYATSTKEDADVTSREELLRIREAVDLPIVVIGGINRSNYRNFKGIGVNGLAVVSAVIAADDIEAAARELSEGFRS